MIASNKKMKKFRKKNETRAVLPEKSGDGAGCELVVVWAYTLMPDI
ncbi:hypothetical protein [Desulfobulbus sp.]|nr:hypothetical protein [Desulfobulbus sp.]